MSQEVTQRGPTGPQLIKFENVNALSDSAFERRCESYSNCSICPMALHLSATKHRCTYGMSEMEFRLLMSAADCEY